MVQFVPMSGGGGVVQLPRDNSDLVNLRLLQEALGSVGSVGNQIKQQADQAALAEALGGTAGTPAIPGQQPLNGAMGPPTPGTPAVPGAPALLPPDLLPVAQSLARAGRFDAAIKMVTDYQAQNAPPTPYQAAQLDISREGRDLQREGLGLEREGLGLRREQHESERDFQERKLALEGQKLAQAGAPDPPKLSDVRNMRLDYRDDSTPFMELATNYGKLESSLASATGEGDLAGIFAFMKALDPPSIVREGEQATAQNTSGALQGLWNTYNQALSGQRLSDPQRKNFLNVAGNYLAQARDRQVTFEQQHRFQAEQAGVDPARVTPDVIGRYREWAPPEPGGATPIQSAGQGIVDTVIQGGKDLLGMGGGEQPAAPAATTAAPPKPGDVEDGFRFRGGDWRDPANWEPAQ